MHEQRTRHLSTRVRKLFTTWNTACLLQFLEVTYVCVKPKVKPLAGPVLALSSLTTGNMLNTGVSLEV
jgi:hypothetical protein